MTHTLRLAPGLSLPLEAVTQTIAIVAKRRAGKSYTMRRLVEQLLKAGQQVVVVDPKGDQWGIRSAADGKGPGLPVIILGGERGDLPLEPSGGEVVAKLVVEERVSVLLDVSLFRKHEVATFMTAFLENLYRMKAREIYRTPMMLVIDEADAIAPQKPQKGEERMLGAAEDIVRRGGQRGIGCVLVTQRSAVLNKNVLTQAQMLVALRTIAPQDLAAMDAWIQVHGEPDQRKTLMESLPSLPVGDAWFWSPGWPTGAGIFERVHVSPIETFDSGATPKPGEKRLEPKAAADVDLEALKRQMAATVEKAKLEDPKLLRKQLHEARTLIKALELKKPAPTKTETIETPVLKEGQLARVEKLVERMGEYVHRLTDMPAWAKELPNQIQSLQSTVNGVRRDVNNPRPVNNVPRVNNPPPRRPVSPIHPKGDSDLSRPQQALLDALAWLETVSIRTPTRGQLALAAEVSSKSSGFEKNVSTLRTGGFISYPHDNCIALTDEGRAVAAIPDAHPTTEDLQESLLRRVSTPQATLLQVLIQVYPGSLSREKLAERANVSSLSSGFEKNVSTLSSLGLVGYPEKGHVAAEPVLFLEESR